MHRPNVSRARWLALGVVLTMITTPAAAAAATVVYLKLNVVNTSTAATGLTGRFDDRLVRLINNGTGTAAGALGAVSKSATAAAINAYNSGGGPALSLTVPPGKAPVVVSAGAGKATNLNADKLDGLDSTQLVRRPVQPWREVGTPGQPPFECQQQIETCSDNWRNFGHGYNTAAFYRDPLGVVRLKGLVEPVGVTAFNVACHGSYFFVLPPGYRPAAIVIAPTIYQDKYARIDILPTGEVSLCLPNAWNTDDWFLLDGIAFRAAP
jgi:hypothetical protein